MQLRSKRGRNGSWLKRWQLFCPGCRSRSKARSAITGARKDESDRRTIACGDRLRTAFAELTSLLWKIHYRPLAPRKKASDMVDEMEFLDTGDAHLCVAAWIHLPRL